MISTIPDFNSKNDFHQFPINKGLSFPEEHFFPSNFNIKTLSTLFVKRYYYIFDLYDEIIVFEKHRG